MSNIIALSVLKSILACDEPCPIASEELYILVIVVCAADTATSAEFIVIPSP